MPRVPSTRSVQPVKSASQKKESPAEAQLVPLLDAAGLDGYKRQHYYVPGRKFQADFAFPEQKLIVEIDGGIFSRRAHGSISGILSDMKRSNHAAMQGFRVMRFTPNEVANNPEDVISQIKAALLYNTETRN